MLGNYLHLYKEQVPLSNLDNRLTAFFLFYSSSNGAVRNGRAERVIDALD